MALQMIMALEECSSMLDSVLRKLEEISRRCKGSACREIEASIWCIFEARIRLAIAKHALEKQVERKVVAVGEEPQ